MTGDEILDAMEHIDPDLIEAADVPVQKRRKPYWVAAVAAVLILAISALSLLHQLTPRQPTLPTLSLFHHIVNPEKVTGISHIGTPSNSSNSNGPNFNRVTDHFYIGIILEAKVVEILPDIYRDPNGRVQYHLLILETVDVIRGENIPQKFFMRIPAYMSPELNQFDSLIVSLHQLGIENYILRNESSSQYEAFSLLFELFSDFSIVPFRNGVWDPSLWEMDGWYFSNNLQYLLNGEEWSLYPAKKGTTIAQCKKNIKNLVAETSMLYEYKVYTQADIGQDTVFAYVAPFENGVFLQEYYFTREGSLRYIRTINGIMTNEVIYVSKDSAVYEGECFTHEDLSNVPNLAEYLDALKDTLNTMSSPHADFYKDKQVELKNTWASAKYFKSNGQVYSIIKICWQYDTTDTTDQSSYYRDTQYFLLSYDGSCREMEREEMLQIIGSETFTEAPYDQLTYYPPTFHY